MMSELVSCSCVSAGSPLLQATSRSIPAHRLPRTSPAISTREFHFRSPTLFRLVRPLPHSFNKSISRSQTLSLFVSGCQSYSWRPLLLVAAAQAGAELWVAQLGGSGSGTEKASPLPLGLSGWGKLPATDRLSCVSVCVCSLVC